MDWFARLGYDTWCVDCEGYGRSDKSRPVNADVSCGADDVAAASDYIMKMNGGHGAVDSDLPRILQAGFVIGRPIKLNRAVFPLGECLKEIRRVIESIRFQKPVLLILIARGSL